MEASQVSLPAGINVVITAPNMKIRNLIIKIIKGTSDIAPNAKKDTVSARRAMYADGRTRTIINTSSTAMKEQLGLHIVSIALEVKDPTDSAFLAKEILEDAGLDAKVHLHPEPEFPEGFITFVSAPELDGIVFLFWPKNPDPAILATVDRAVPWSMEDEDAE